MIFALEQTNRTENHLLKWILPRFCLGFPEEFGKVLQMSADHQDTFPNNSTWCHTYEGNKNILERLERLEKIWNEIDTTCNKHKFVFFPLATSPTSYDLATFFYSFHLPWQPYKLLVGCKWRLSNHEVWTACGFHSFTLRVELNFTPTQLNTLKVVRKEFRNLSRLSCAIF